jgi:hypothetical protein
MESHALNLKKPVSAFSAKKGASVGNTKVMWEKAACKNNKKSHHLKES